MRDRKLLIADPSEEFSQAVAHALGEQYQVHICKDGSDALDYLRHSQPTLLLLDPMLPQLDGLTLMQTARQEGILPPVIAATRLNSDYAAQLLQEFGVLYIFLKPCAIHAVVARIRDLCEHTPEETGPGSDPMDEICRNLLLLGISPKLQGYQYLQPAILEMAKAPGTPVTKRLYPAVAETFGIRPSQVERSIRNAICTAWEDRDEQAWQHFFPRRSDGTVKRPTNAAFISRLADAIHLP